MPPSIPDHSPGRSAVHLGVFRFWYIFAADGAMWFHQEKNDPAQPYTWLSAMAPEYLTHFGASGAAPFLVRSTSRRRRLPPCPFPPTQIRRAIRRLPSDRVGSTTRFFFRRPVSFSRAQLPKARHVYLPHRKAKQEYIPARCDIYNYMPTRNTWLTLLLLMLKC